MGFVYSQNGLCCDFCLKSKPQDNVKKIPCPYGYCQAWASCKTCHEKKLHLRSSLSNDKTHKEICKPLSLEYKKRQDEKQTLLQSGLFLRVAAINQDSKVKVLFANKEGHKKAFLMSHQTYDKIPLLTNATIQDYEKLEPIEEIQDTKLYVYN